MSSYKPLKGYENLYIINKKGIIKNNEGIIIKPFESPDGYFRLTLWKYGKKKNHYLHRLIAINYIPNPNPKKFKEINHKDKNRKNNSIKNLEWADRQINNLNRDFSNF